MQTPSSPSIEPSEPEKQQRVTEKSIQLLNDPHTLKIVTLKSIRTCLGGVGLDVDSDGFIVTAEEKAYVEPYAFDSATFNATDEPSDNPFKTYYNPERTVENIIVPKERLHLTDLHAVYVCDGNPRIVRDNRVNLREALTQTGVTFSTVTKWSNALDLVRDADEQTVEISMESERPLSLTCLDCEYRGTVTSWNQGDSICCPECNCPWDCLSVRTCTSCQTQHRWDERTEADTGEYWTPSCPDCGAGPSSLRSKDRY